MCIVEQTLNVRPLTPVSSDVNDLEALTSNHFLLGNKNDCLPYLPCAEEFVDHRNLFRQTQAYANLISDRFRKDYLRTLNNCKSGHLQLTNLLQKTISFGWSKTVTSEDFMIWVEARRPSKGPTEWFDQRKFERTMEFTRDQWWSRLLCYQTRKMFSWWKTVPEMWRPIINNFLKHLFFFQVCVDILSF